MSTFRFKCATCGEIHEDIPSFGFDCPDQYHAVPENERQHRCTLGSDECVIDSRDFFVRGCLDIPILGTEEMFTYGVWVSLSNDSFAKFKEYYGEAKRSHIGPFFGWLCNWVGGYPNSLLLKTQVHLRDDGFRPFIALEATDHPLAVEQRNGITIERVAEIYAQLMH